jgi:phosphatidylinositol alpha-1,6-mannosyltransferase
VDSLLLTPELFANEGGIARILRLYLKALCELAAMGDSVRLLSLNDSLVDSSDIRKYSNSTFAEWEVCNRSKLRFVAAAFRMGRRSNRIICGHVAQLPVAWAVSKIKPSLSYYLVAHGIEVWRPFSFLERRALKGARRVFCVSEFTRKQLLEHCPLPAGNAVVLSNALDPYLNPESTIAANDAVPTILTISRLSVADGYKGIGHLIAAMPAVSEAIPGARLRVVGRGDGLSRLQAQADKLRLSGIVEFAGYRSDKEIRRDLEQSRLFALPSQKEGFGLVYLEAMAHGRPCLGARSGGVPEVITPETGVLVEYGDIPGIASAIIAALRREWKLEPMLERAKMFSYLRFKERLASLLSE